MTQPRPSQQQMVRRFRVSLEKILPDPSIRNPFLAFRTAESFEGAKCKVLVRTWEFDAMDEQEVRSLLEDARRNGEPQVQGMKIRSIESISPKSYWVGVKKGECQTRDVIHHDEPTQSTHPNYDYMVGPYTSKVEAEKRAKSEKNLTGTFTDPFCNGGQGR